MANPPTNGLLYTLGVVPGIKRDGTQFESREFTDGVWARFQRGVPRKTGGYQQILRDPNGIPRGMISNGYDTLNYLFIGNQNTLDVCTTGTTLGVGNGPYPANFIRGYNPTPLIGFTAGDFTVNGNETTKFATGTKVVFEKTSTAEIFTVGTATYDPIALTTTVTFTPATLALTPTDVYISNDYYAPDPNYLWQFDLQYSPFGDALQVLAHPGKNLSNIDNGVDTPVYVGNILPVSGTNWEFEPLVDSAGANPTYEVIKVDGGVTVLYPFIFVYGSNGFIANNNVDLDYGLRSANDWNGPLANRVNVAAGKIVKGLPVRGGTQSPSGLFWATDSLIRVSYSGLVGELWRYDIISSQISIMSSNAVVEMDGIYYWMGVDRFYKYNGIVSVVPNDKNVNWLFDNLNYEQRQKVWATKVPRYNEIWFFYPRGSATECTDAIIYNVKDDIWYDAGQAAGARRSCGYPTEVFPNPIWCGWEFKFTVGADAEIVGLFGSNGLIFTGDVTADFPVGSRFQFSNIEGDPYYTIDSISYDSMSNSTTLIATEIFSPAPTVGDFIYSVNNGYTIWQHEKGVNQVDADGTAAIASSVTTCDISFVGGDPAQDSPKTMNRRIHLTRIEPDFVQVGNMTVEVVGRPFARGTTTTSAPFTFGPNDGKVDMRIENRESTLKFSSNVINGDYQMGRILITADPGDERP